MTRTRRDKEGEPVKIPLDPEDVLRGLLAVDPQSPPAEDDQDEKSNDPE